MAAILDSAILHKNNFSHSFWLNLMMAAILNSANLNSTILDSAILVFPLKLTHTCQDWFPPFAQKNFTHSFWINLMMAAILNSAILDSPILHKTLTQTYSIWLKLIHSHLTWWWQPSWICHLGFNHLSFSSHLTHTCQGSCITICHKNTYLQSASNHLHKKTSLIHSDSTWWWQPSWILPSCIQPFCTKKTSLIHSDSTWWWQPSWILPSCNSTILHKTLTQTNSIWLKLIHSLSTWWWQPSWTLPSWINPFCIKLWLKLIHSDSNSFILNNLMMAAILPSWILPSWIQPFCTKHWFKLIQSDSNSFILTQLDDGSHLEFCHLGFTHFAQNSDSN